MNLDVHPGRGRVPHPTDNASYLLPLLPLRGVRLGFSFTRATGLPFFHQPAVSALVRTLMDGALGDEPRLWIDIPDTGRSWYGRGDPYAIHIWCCASAEQLLETLVQRLCRLPKGAPSAARGRAFGDNLSFHYATDCLSGEPYRGVAHLPGYGPDQLAAELDFYLTASPVLLRLLSPARILRPKGPDRPTKGEGRYVHDRGELAGPLLAQRIDDTLSSLLTAVGALAPARDEARFQVNDDDIGWYDVTYYGTDQRENPMGGIIGRVALNIADPAALPALVLGQYIGIGQRRTFGWGRYRLETAAGQGTLAPRRRTRGVLQRAADPGNLELAYRAITANSQGQRDPDAHRDPFDDDLSHLAMVDHPEHVDRLVDDVRSSLRLAAGLSAVESPRTLPSAGAPEAVPASHDDPVPNARQPGTPRPSAAPLVGCILQREGKAPRPLAVPDIPERIAQRAVLQILRADLDSLLSAAAYGYRRGFSRADARDRLQALYRQGYEWVYEADIDDFFDTVSHQRLETRLRSLLPDDPVVDQLLAWMAAPVSYRGHLIDRPAGLPQGSPLSPLLANLMLDDFDADLEHPRRAHGAVQLEDLPPDSWLARLARRVPTVLDDTPDAPVPTTSTTPPRPAHPTSLIQDEAKPRVATTTLAGAADPAAGAGPGRRPHP